jgi:hypothetical protein
VVLGWRRCGVNVGLRRRLAATGHVAGPACGTAPSNEEEGEGGVALKLNIMNYLLKSSWKKLDKSKNFTKTYQLRYYWTKIIALLRCRPTLCIRAKNGKLAK